MKELRSLDVSHNTIESLQEVAMLSKLLVLKCSSNHITDLSWIAGLKCLEELWIRDNRVESAQLAHLQQLTALQTLVVHPNPCTERDDYVLPWLQRVDTTVVSEELREEARHTEERVSLDSGATDCSLFSLSGRSEGNQALYILNVLKSSALIACSDPRSNDESAEDRVTTPPAPLTVSKKPAKSNKQLKAEEFMRAFPIQDFIPIDSKGEPVVILDNQLQDPETEVHQDKSLDSNGFTRSETEGKQNEINAELTLTDISHLTAHDNGAQENRLLPKVETGPKPGGTSALLDSVLTLPTFGNHSFLKKKKSQPQLPANKTKHRVKPKTAPVESSGSAMSFRQNEEYVVVYPSSTVPAIQVRCDGSAIARWSSGSIAISVDFETYAERSGYRVYAAHKDGQLALSFDPAGVGFLNAYPSGKTLISTTSGGDGLLFDIGTGAISRQWDAQGRLRDGRCESVETLGDEPDGSLLCRLSEHLAVRVSLMRSHLIPSESTDNTKHSFRPNPISLQIYFAGAPGIRHVFVNSANPSVRCNNDACDYALGKASSKEDKAIKAKKTHVEHSDLLSSIRAAVAGL
ncbi:hypothetical protein PHPALM_29501 [Phytophthora palmivora]|uniref:Uncharacterized protein n=1 Tax=Phytophthora palmivora TaxID=4796 RepID=A0A2P4X7E4_9STRA|nr:hypothetical protein PHPALM_29501 [Phytophthora palmivora]